MAGKLIAHSGAQSVDREGLKLLDRFYRGPYSGL
jgi:hypothetical protein